MSSMLKYREWLRSTDSTESEVPYEEWLAGTYINDQATQKQHLVASIVSGEAPRVGRGAQALMEIMTSAEEDLRAVKVSIARNRSTRVARMQAFLDMTEERLMTKINLGEASVPELLATARHLRTSIRDDVGLIDSVIASGERGSLDGSQFNLNFGDHVVNLRLGSDAAQETLKSRDSRDRVRTVLDGLISVVKNGRTPEPEPSA